MKDSGLTITRPHRTALNCSIAVTLDSKDVTEIPTLTFVDALTLGRWNSERVGVKWVDVLQDGRFQTRFIGGAAMRFGDHPPE